MADVDVTRNTDRSRWEAQLDGELAGFAEYQVTDQLYVFTHTEVDPKFEGEGVGSALVRTALDEVRVEGNRQVLPICPFVKAWIGRHPDYRSLVYGVRKSTATD
ncbi:MAG: GNAT family N-acetyltransferase [Propionibacteriaceae bacterium]